jgi:hypothetical protein
MTCVVVDLAAARQKRANATRERARKVVRVRFAPTKSKVVELPQQADVPTSDRRKARTSETS